MLDDKHRYDLEPINDKVSIFHTNGALFLLKKTSRGFRKNAEVVRNGVCIDLMGVLIEAVNLAQD